MPQCERPISIPIPASSAPACAAAIPAWILERIADPGSLFVPVWRNQNLVIELDGGEPRAAVLHSASISEIFGVSQERLASGEVVFLGVIEERAHFALDLSPVEAPLDMLRSPALAASGVEAAAVRFADLRQVGPRIERHEGALLALARAMMFWHSRHRYCGLCGSPTRSEEAGHMRRCTNPACNAMHFPRTDPAVIMLVTDGERALLGRNKNFPLPGMYSTLAGFVEPGESLEDAVAREVREETGDRGRRGPLPLLAALALPGQHHARLSRRGADDRDHDRLRRARGRPLVRPRLAVVACRRRQLPHAAPRLDRPPPDRGLAARPLMLRPGLSVDGRTGDARAVDQRHHQEPGDE